MRYMYIAIILLVLKNRQINIIIRVSAAKRRITIFQLKDFLSPIALEIVPESASAFFAREETLYTHQI